MQIKDLTGIENAAGLASNAKDYLAELKRVYELNICENGEKFEYYEGKKKVANLGYSLPHSIDNLNITCGWGRKAIEAVSNRSIFDSAVSKDEAVTNDLNSIIRRNNLATQYRRALASELIIGCTFAKVSNSGNNTPVIRFHSPFNASGLWNSAKGTLLAGMCIMDNAKSKYDYSYIPTLVHLELPYQTWVIRRDTGSSWSAECFDHAMPRPLMQAFVNKPTDLRPFGQSRLNAPVRCIIDDYIRGMTRLIYASEIYTSPQKVLLGASEDALNMDNMEMYLTNMLMISRDDNGDVPNIQQFNGSSMQPLIEVMQYEAKQFCNATDIPLCEMSIVTDTPSSAEAIYAQKETLITNVEFLNEANGEAMCEVLKMAQAVKNNCTFNGLSDTQLDIMPLFKNPAMPSIAAMADAMTKIASLDPSFAGSSVFYEGMGFDAATISRIEENKKQSQIMSSFLGDLQKEQNTKA